MRWLTRARRDEGGAVIVILVAAIVVMVGMAALVIDVGAILDEKRQLQNGADAAALAVAQSCGEGTCRPERALPLAKQNARDAQAAVDTPAIDMVNKRVTVRTSTVESGGSNILPYSFGQVLSGVKGNNVEASASARWGGLHRAAVIPLTVSKCEFDKATSNNTVFDVPRVIFFHSKADSCTGPSGTDHPGGFGWLKDNNDSVAGDCRVTPAVNDKISVDTGVVGTPKSCEGKIPVDTDILLPIYDSLTGGTGGNGIYNIYGFAQIHVASYFFANNNQAGTPVPCGAPDTCLGGSFVRFVGIGEYGGPSLGNRVALVS